MAHHEIDLLTKFHFAILQEASPTNHQGHDKTPADESNAMTLFTTTCPSIVFCTFKRTRCIVSWLRWQLGLSHEDIKHILVQLQRQHFHRLICHATVVVFAGRFQ